jgi:autophagy-related protein 5
MHGLVNSHANIGSALKYLKEMANDREVLREIWEGRLPVCFQLNSEEVYSLQAPDAYYLMVPRLSYFPIVTDKVR